MDAQKNNTTEQKSNITIEILNRLEEFLRTTGDTFTTLTNAINVSPAYFTTTRNTKSIIGTDKIAKILFLYPQLSGDWLLTGIGLMLKAAHSLKEQSDIIAKEQALNTAIHGLNDIQKQLRDLLKQVSKTKLKPKKSNK
jgi:hypothetical protein